MASAKDDLAALNRFAMEPLVAQLASHVPSLSFFHLLDCTRDEIAHSRVIATLFDPRRHRQSETALRAFVASIGAELDKSQADVKHKLKQAVTCSWTKVQVRREVFRIDVVVEIFSSVGNFVIGIENKIDAAEQPEQVARYQESLDLAYPHQTALVVFLSPSKLRRPSTANAKSRVPCVVLDYSAVADAIRAALGQAIPDSADARILRELERHLEEDILDNQPIRNVVRELWKSHPRALELAMEHRPRLGDVQVEYERLIQDRFGGDVEFEYYRPLGQLREIQFTRRSWWKAGWPFTFMFRSRQFEPPHVRVLIWHEALQRRKNALAEWARRVNPKIGNRLDETFRPVSDWKVWRRLLREDDYPSDAVLDERGFDKETASEAASRVFAIIDMLEPHIEQVSNGKPIRRKSSP